MAKKEYELTRALLCFAASCLREGDWAALRDMGFSHREAEALQQINLSDLSRLEGKLTGHILRVSLDQGAFWAVLEQVKEASKQQQIRVDFIKRDAPSDMMEKLFGMGVKEYTRARRAAGVPPSAGRPVEATEGEARSIWLAWEKLVAREPDLVTPVDWMSVADSTGLSLRLVWRVVQRWRVDDGEAWRAKPVGTQRASYQRTHGVGSQ